MGAAFELIFKPMPFAIEKTQASRTVSVPPETASPVPGDGTRQLLQSGLGTLSAGIVAAALTIFVFGGIGPNGPHTNAGWLLLMIALMCLPFGFLLSLLGMAKWLRNRQLNRAPRNR